MASEARGSRLPSFALDPLRAGLGGCPGWAGLRAPLRPGPGPTRGQSSRSASSTLSPPPQTCAPAGITWLPPPLSGSGAGRGAPFHAQLLVCPSSPILRVSRHRRLPPGRAVPPALPASRAIPGSVQQGARGVGHEMCPPQPAAPLRARLGAGWSAGTSMGRSTHSI